MNTRKCKEYIDMKNRLVSDISGRRFCILYLYKSSGFWLRGVTSGVVRTRIFESLNILYVGRDWRVRKFEGKVWRMKRLKFESLSGNLAWKFEALATRCAREQGERPLENA